jgi:hypothetical protein
MKKGVEDGMCNIHGDIRYVYKILVEKCEGKRPLVRPEHDLKANMKINVSELGCGDTDWVEVV